MQQIKKVLRKRIKSIKVEFTTNQQKRGKRLIISENNLTLKHIPV